MAPLRGQPGVVEVQPTVHRADVECGHDGLELVGRARHTCPASERRARDDRAEQLRARRVIERLKAAGQRVHQAVMRGFEGKIRIDFGIADVVGDIDEFFVPVGTLRGANIYM